MEKGDHFHDDWNQLIKNGINGTEKTIILGVVVVLWFVIIKKWEKEEVLLIAKEK